MIKIAQEKASTKNQYTRNELLDLIRSIDNIIKNSEYEYDDNYIISFDDMATIKESIRKIRRDFLD